MHPREGLVRILQSDVYVYFIGPRRCEYQCDWTMCKTKMTFRPIQLESHVLLVYYYRTGILVPLPTVWTWSEFSSRFLSFIFVFLVGRIVPILNFYCVNIWSTPCHVKWLQDNAYSD